MKNLPYFYEPDIQQPFCNLSEETARHCTQVLRMKVDDLMYITDGNGSLYTASISVIHKKECTVAIVSKEAIELPKQQVSIGISILKNPVRFEWFLEKATEIGVHEIVPVICDHTEKKNFRFDRMRQIVVSAMLQSKQVWLPKLHQPTAFNNIITANSSSTKLIAHCNETTKTNISSLQSSSNKTIILIGPEGDFSSEEILLARKNDFLEISLGNTRLRSETAGVVAATFLCNALK